MSALTQDAITGAHQQAPRSNESQTPSWWRIVLAGASWVLLAAMVALAVAVVLLPAITGAKPYTVLTGSMEPAYPPGTLVVARSVDADELRIGDVITFQLRSGEPQVVTHRIVGVGADAEGAPLFVTRGDANNVEDANPVRPVQVVGRLWYSVPYIGWVNNVINGSTRMWVLPLAAAALLAYGAVMFAQALRERRSR